jgi:hypothetical protein
MLTPIFREISIGQRGVDPCRYLYLKIILKGREDRSMEGDSIAPKNLSTSLRE